MWDKEQRNRETKNQGSRGGWGLVTCRYLLGLEGGGGVWGVLQEKWEKRGWKGVALWGLGVGEGWGARG